MWLAPFATSDSAPPSGSTVGFALILSYQGPFRSFQRNLTVKRVPSAETLAWLNQ